MERELMLTGIGGQGVQLAARVIAQAATLEGRHAMFFGLYGGTMRGGNTDSTIVVGEETIQSPPIVSRTWSAIVMHHEYWEPLHAKLQPDAVVLLNSTLFEGEFDRDRHRVFEIGATEAARELGNPVVASMIMAGAYANVTGLVGLDALLEAMKSAIPSYRQQHVELNREALLCGHQLGETGAAPAWTPM